MTTTKKTLRYQLPRKALKGDCPQCGPRHRKTLSRYIDTQTGDPLPEEYGRCDRESNCGYHLNPYHKGASGLSYHDEQKAMGGIGPLPKDWFRCAGKLKRNGSYKQGAVQWLMEIKGATLEQAELVVNYVFDKPAYPTQSTPSNVSICTIPEEVFQASLGHYEQNQLAKLLSRHLSADAAKLLLDRFSVGTSSRWPGACVFWYIDELDRIRGGQIKQFGEDFHTVKYHDKEGRTRSKTSWVHAALIRRYTQKQEPVPAWLTEYDEKAERSPCLFGLSQLKTAPVDQPIALVEAPKTAILCSHYFPDLIWLAAGGKSYLNAERLAPLKGRKISLFPDLNAYHDLVNEKGQINKGWLSRARELQAKGFDLTVSDYLEKLATDEDRAKGLDLADYLLSISPDTRPRLTYADGETIYGEVLEMEPCDTYPADWDIPSRVAFPQAPLVFDSVEQQRRIQVCVMPIDADEPPALTTSPNREAFAQALGINPDQLPLFQLQSKQPA